VKPLKLTIEPNPATTAGISLSRQRPSGWDKIRKQVYAEHDYRCAICGVDPKHAPKKVYPRHAPKLTDPALIEKYGKRIEEYRRNPLRLPSKVRLECHEVWGYNEATRAQRLSGFTALCSRCHLGKHWNGVQTQISQSNGHLIKGGLWWYRGAESDVQNFALCKELNPHQYFLEDHFLWVNDCDLKTLVEHVEEAAEVCFRRSQIEWQVDFGEYAELLKT
jgi:hypothetical protein